MRIRHITLALAIGIGAFAGAAGAQTTHDYEFTSGLNDAVPGGATLAYSSRVTDANGNTVNGSVSGGFYNFDRGEGLLLDSQLPGATYTIDISTTFANVDGYRKLISFNNITDDAGLYILNGGLSLFPQTGGPANVVAAGTPFDVRLSRDGTTNAITAYLNNVAQFTYSDNGGQFVASTSLYFLRDDTRQNGEDSAGSADYIRISTSADGAPPVTATPAVPEPATWAMALLGFGMIGSALRRRHMAALPAGAAA